MVLMINHGKEDFKVEVAEDSTPLHQHFIIISDYFKKFGQIDRQEFVWETLRKEIPDSELINVTMLLTFTEDEAKEIFGN